MSVDKALRVLQARASLDLGEQAKVFMEAANTQALRESEASRCDAGLLASRAEIARLESAGFLNVASYHLVRRLHQVAHVDALAARGHLAEANQALDHHRSELARLRQLERGLGRVIERREDAARRALAGRDEAMADDLWLQASRRPASC